MEGALKLVSTVGQLAGKEYRQLRAVGGRVTELRDELATMNAVLRMMSEAEEGAVDHFVREWMKQVRELAYDAEDCVHLYIFRIKCQPAARSGFVVWSKRVLATLFPRHRLAGDIKNLRARAVVISERHARYGVNREALRRSAAFTPALPAVSASSRALVRANQPDLFIGRTEQTKKLAKMVVDEADMTRKVFTIVGFGGLGKTTMAMEVCGLLEESFDRQAQASVSEAFDGGRDLKGLLKRLLQQIAKPRSDNETGINEDSLGDIDNMDVGDLAGKLQDLLKDKRYLVVVDDVWTIEAWGAIISKLPENNKGSRIIVTTRQENVAKECSSSSSCEYRMEPLSKEDSRKLFLSRAFGSDSCPPQLKKEMEKVLRKCGGLPMAIISIAGIFDNFKSSEDRDMWERVGKSIGSHMENHPSLEGMKQILTLGYNRLHHDLKACMMYFSIFPEDYIIPKDRLLRRWIAEGLIPERRGLTLMEVAESYYDELVSKSMIQRAIDVYTFYDGRVAMCRVHDLMLEVMVSKSLESNFVSLLGGPYKGMLYDDRIRRLSVHGGEDSASPEGPAHGMRGMNMQHVRSLSMFDLEDSTKLLDSLGKFNLLRVLDLEDCMGLENKHLIAVCRMYLLRFLSLKGTNVSEMPAAVGELENLQTLDARHTCFEYLPETVTKLEKLEELQFTDRVSSRCWMARQGLKRMKALRRVNKVVFGCDASAAEELGELLQLRELGMYVDKNNGIDQYVLGKVASSLSKLYNLRWLNISNQKHESSSTLNFLHKVNSPPCLLRYLRIGARIDGLPFWVKSLTNLVELVVAWTYLVDDQLFGTVSELPSLKRMDLEAYSYTGKKLVAEDTHSFPALMDLDLNFDLEGMEVLEFQEGSMPVLETLRVKFYNREDKKVSGMEHLASLKEVQLVGTRNNPAMKTALAQLKEVNAERLKLQKVNDDERLKLKEVNDERLKLIKEVNDGCIKLIKEVNDERLKSESNFEQIKVIVRYE